MTSAFTSLRAALRLARVTLHLLRGLFSVGLIYPLLDRPQRLTMKQRWSRQLVERLGVTIKTPAGMQNLGAGRTPEIPDATAGDAPRGLLVANHISFLDVFVINALAPAAFVAKQEVRHWPLLGWLARHTETIFLARGSRRAAQATREHLLGQLSAGHLVAVFPEGTTSNGDQVLPFHAALFQSAIDSGAPILPWVLHYSDESGQTSHAADYVGETSLLECLWSIASAEKLSVHVTACPAITAQDADRRHLAARAHHVIAHALGQQVGRHDRRIKPVGKKPR